MKYRNGFVTNSSSSSFILAFKDKSLIAEELYEEKCLSLYQKDWLLERCLDRPFNSLNECLNVYGIEMRPIVEFKIRSELENKLGFEKMLDWKAENYEEFLKLVEDRLSDEVDQLAKQLKGLNFFTRVVVSDHGDSDLEHIIMPQLNCVKACINNH